MSTQLSLLNEQAKNIGDTYSTKVGARPRRLSVCRPDRVNFMVSFHEPVLASSSRASLKIWPHNLGASAVLGARTAALSRG